MSPRWRLSGRNLEPEARHEHADSVSFGSAPPSKRVWWAASLSGAMATATPRASRLLEWPQVSGAQPRACACLTLPGRPEPLPSRPRPGPGEHEGPHPAGTHLPAQEPLTLTCPAPRALRSASERQTAGDQSPPMTSVLPLRTEGSTLCLTGPH